MLPPDSFLSEFTDKYHLWPWALLFLFFGFLGAVNMAVRYFLRFLEEIQEAVYDFRARCAETRRRYEESVSQRTSASHRAGGD
jgi:hypothetical protein